MSITSDLLELKKLQLAELERQKRREYCLPHLHGFKHFWWTRKFYESTNPYTFLCASNQSGKSIVSIRKCVDWCTDQDKWKVLWPRQPLYGMYFYPSLKLATREFENKWVKEILPREEMKDDPYYGWEAEYQKGEIAIIRFKNGFNLYFMSYTQKASDLQASSPSFVFCDEEMPEDLWGEVSARLLATKGHYHLVCTPTLGEELWRKVFEGDFMKVACKIKVTMYDTINFEDGSPGLRTRRDIDNYKATLPSQRDIDVRVYGKFAKLEGLVYSSFSADHNVVKPKDIPSDWIYYAGIDIGSGGNGHPAAISIVGIRPDYKEGRLVRFWRGNSQENTTNSDILQKYQELAKGLQVYQIYYDWASADFALICQNAGVIVYKAEKNHQIGQDLLNTLFKHRMLQIEEGDLTPGLVEELLTYKHSDSPKKAKNDGIDSLRYSVSKIPWDTSHIGLSTAVIKEEKKEKKKPLTRGHVEESNAFLDGVDEEVEFWNDYY